MSKNINRKKPRSRSPEKKAAQFEKILEAGKQLFLEKGKDGFSLRGLAKILGMNQNNLYNYVESKRELWIALRNKFFKQIRDKNIQIIKSHHGAIIQLLMKIFKNFLDYADNDFGAFSMMHLIESPPSDKIGPFEKDYREFKFLDGTIRVLKSAIAAEEIEENKAGMMSFLIYSLLLGAAIVENHMRTIEENHSYKKDPTSEILQFGQADFSRAEFRENVLKKLEDWLTQNSL
ncbi:MAG: TetR/AcrR family transcriptional regulator [Candidatus Thorarchaeota archaeon]